MPRAQGDEVAGLPEPEGGVGRAGAVGVIGVLVLSAQTLPEGPRGVGGGASAAVLVEVVVDEGGEVAIDLVHVGGTAHQEPVRGPASAERRISSE